MAIAPAKQATIYRMVMPGHTCPYGLKAADLLRREGYSVDDHWLTTREETDAFKAKHGVKTTPLTFINGERVGGYDDLRRFAGKSVRDPKALTYRPVIALFSVTALMALAASYAVLGTLFTPLTVLITAALATATKYGKPSIFASGPQGFSETLYAYLSQANNNGSAFAGYTGYYQPNPGNLGAHGITFADLLGGLSMVFARFAPILIVLDDDPMAGTVLKSRGRGRVRLMDSPTEALTVAEQLIASGESAGGHVGLIDG